MTTVGTRHKPVPAARSLRPSARPSRVPKAQSGLYPIAQSLGSSAAQSRIRDITSAVRGRGTDGSVDYHERMGAIVVAHLYDGNVGAWRRRRNDRSLRELAAQLSDVLHQSSLYRSLSIYDLLERHSMIPGIRSLGVRALTAIARAPLRKQKALLECATKEQWTGSRVEKQVRQLPRKSKRGRRRTPILLRTLTKMSSEAQTLLETSLLKLDVAQLRHCLDLAAHIADEADSLHKAVSDALRAKEKKAARAAKRAKP